jgi:hypothetical protein
VFFVEDRTAAAIEKSSRSFFWAPFSAIQNDGNVNPGIPNRNTLLRSL